MATNRELWEEAYAESKLRDADFTTMSGIPLDGVYGPDDGAFPGQYPYTRGPYASMYRSKLWTMRMFAGFGTADDTNWRFKEIIKAGGDGLSTAFDMLAGGMVAFGVHKMSQSQAKQIEEHTGVPPEELEDEDLEAAMKELQIAPEPLTDEDRAAGAGSD